MPDSHANTVYAAATLSQIVIYLAAAVLLYVAIADLKYYKIRNEAIVVLFGLFLVHAFLAGQWKIFYWNVGFAALMFLIMLCFYLMRWMGGGDFKLLTVAFLWIGPFCAFPFAVLLLFFVGVHSLAAKLKFVEIQLRDNRKLIAFAPSIAGAFIGVLISGCIYNPGYGSQLSWIGN